MRTRTESTYTLISTPTYQSTGIHWERASFLPAPRNMACYWMAISAAAVPTFPLVCNGQSIQQMGGSMPPPSPWRKRVCVCVRLTLWGREWWIPRKCGTADTAKGGKLSFGYQEFHWSLWQGCRQNNVRMRHVRRETVRFLKSNGCPCPS